MANSAPGQNATVEEILASIRQAISEDDAKRTGERPRAELRSLSDRRPVAHVSNVFPEKDSDAKEPTAEAEPAVEANATDEADSSQSVIQLAIEQALDGVRAELESSKPQPSRLRPRQMQEVAAVGQRAVPRAAVRVGPALIRREAPGQRRALLSPHADAQVAASFDDLAKAMIEGNAHKLDEVVENLLRPMLKNWLEGNLPQMVERLVREEIERVSRGHQ